MQQRSKSKWLQKAFVFLIAITIVATYSLPQSFGMFGAQTAKAAKKPLPDDTGTIQLLGEDESDKDNLSDVEGKNLKYKLNDNFRPESYDYRVSIKDTTPAAGRKIRIEIGEGLEMVNVNEVGLKELFDSYEIVNQSDVEHVDAGARRYQFAPEQLIKTYRGKIKYIEGELKRSIKDYDYDFTLAMDPYLLYKEVDQPVKVTYWNSNNNNTVIETGKGEINTPPVYEEGEWTRMGAAVSGGEYYRDVAIATSHFTTETNNNRFFYKRLFNCEVVYEVDEGVKLRLPEGMDFAWELSKQNENKYVLKNKKAISQWTNSTQLPVFPTLDFSDKNSLMIKAHFIFKNLKGEILQNVKINLPYIKDKSIRDKIENSDIFVQYANVDSYLKRTEENNKNDGGFVRTGMSDLNDYSQRIADYSKIGNLSVGNGGKSDSGEQTCVYEFDESKAHVMAVPLIIPEHTVLDEVNVVTTKDRKIKVSIDKKGPQIYGKGYTKAYSSNKERYLNANEIGLRTGEYIKSVIYDIESIPAQNESFSDAARSGIYSGAVFGKLVDKSAKIDEDIVIGSVEVYDRANKNTTTGKGNIIRPGLSKTAAGKYNIYSQFGYVPVSQEVQAGETIKMTGLYSGIPQTPYDVVETAMQSETYSNLYIRVPSGATLENFRIGYNDNPAPEPVEETYDPEASTEPVVGETKLGIIKDLTKYVDGYRPKDIIKNEKGSYYKIDLTGIPSEILGTGGFSEYGGITGAGSVRIFYDIKTSKTTPAGFYTLKDTFFMESKHISQNEPNDNFAWLNSTVDVLEDNPFDFKTDGGKLITCAEIENTTYGNTIYPNIVVRTKAESKTRLMENYINYDPDDPQTVLPVGIGDEDAVQMRVGVTNLSGVEAPEGTTVWMPIPKQDQDWGDLTKGSKTKEGSATGKAPYSLELQKTLTADDIDMDVWDVAYGVGVTPQSSSYDTGWDANNGDWYTKAQIDADATKKKAVNCVRLVAKTKIPATKDGDAWHENIEIAVAADKNHASEKNSVLVVCPLVYRDLSIPLSGGAMKNYSGIEPGEATAMTIATGKVKGTVFNDANKNGQWDNGENAVDPTGDGSYEVILWGGPKGQRQMIDKTTLEADGTYKFNGVSTDDVYSGYYSVRITNRDGKGKDFRGVNDGDMGSKEMLVSPKYQNTEGGKSRNNAFIHNTSVSDETLKGYAFSSPITAIDADGWSFTNGGTYNCGVYWQEGMAPGVDTKETVTFKMDAEKGTMKDRTEDCDWIEVTKPRNGKGKTANEFEYKGAAGDTLRFPKVTAGDGYKFLGWVPADENGKAVEGAVPCKDPADVVFGQDITAYIPVFTSEDEQVSAKDLQDSINSAKGITENDEEREKYTDDSLKDLEDAIKAAEEIAKDPNATNKDRKAAKDGIDDAVSNLKTPREDLKGSIDKAKDIDPSDYTPETGKDFTDALGRAEDEFNDPDATKDELTEAKEGLDNAIGNLVPTKEGLRKAAEAAENIDTTGMTDDSKKRLEDAIDNANEVANDPSSTDEDRKDALDRLNDAIDKLLPIDKAALQKAIKDAERIDPAKYTEDSVDKLNKETAKGKDVFADKEATEDEVKAATEAINKAINDLVPTNDTLKQAIKDAKKIDKDKYTPESVKALEDAIANGEKVSKDPNATDAQRKAAEDAIKDAIKNLVPKNDTLKDAIDDAKKIDTTGMTEDSKKALEDAIKAAEDVLNDPNATDADKKKALDDLNEAIKGLTPTTDGLKKAIDDAKKIDTTGCTPETVKALEDAIKKAEEVADDPYASDEDRRQALEDLEKAIKGLKTPADIEKDKAKDDLDNGIDDAKGIDTSGMTDAEKKAVDDAVKKAEDVLNDPDSTTGDLKKALEDLQKELDRIKKEKADREKAKSELDSKIQDAGKIDTTGMTDESRKALEDAIKNAQNVANNPNATAAQLKAAMDTLQKAVDGLTKKNGNDASKVQEAVNEADKLPTKGASPETIKALNDAIAQAKKVLADPNATPQQLAEALNKLNAAMSKVKEETKIVNLMKKNAVGLNAMSFENSLLKLKKDLDINGSSFGMLRARGVAKSNNAVKLTWTKAPKAVKYVVYGNRCATKYPYKKLKTTKARSFTPKKILGKKLLKGTYYKMMVVAVDKNNKVVAVSKTIHVATKGGKKGNYKAVKVTKPKKSKLTLKKGKSYSVKAKQVRGKQKVANHRKLAFESDNVKVAKVNGKGKITAGKKKGKATIYVYAQNGVYKTIKLTVK